MELGRRICTAQSPQCAACPIAASCEAYRLGIQRERPYKRRKARTPHYDVTAAVTRRGDGRILIAQRPLDGMLGGLWEFPGGKREPGESLHECLRREIKEELDIDIAVDDQIGVVRHAYSHFRITLFAFECVHIGGQPATIGCADFAWVALDELDQYAFPVTDQKIITMICKGESQLGLDLP